MANEILGVDEIIAKFQQLGKPSKIKNSATRASRKAMNIVKKSAVQNAKALDDKDTAEKIWKNIVVKPSKTKAGFVMMKVGVKGGAKKTSGTGNSGGDTWYWRFPEFGTAHQPATPFIRPALNNNRDAVQSTFISEFTSELDKEIAKL